MIDHTECTDKIHTIVNILKNSTGEEVYGALHHAPTANLFNILEMITVILKHRHEEHGEME